MRKRVAIISSAVLLTGTSIVLAQDQGVQAIVGNVFLQDTTPGNPQIGHAAIKGTFRAGQVFVQQGSKATIPIVGNNTATGSAETIGGSFSVATQAGTALRGTSTSVTGVGIGVKGVSRASGGTGVMGISETTSNNFSSGVLGLASGPLSTGVSGSSNDGSGVNGQSLLGVGVSAQSSSSTKPALFAVNNSLLLSGDQIGALVESSLGVGVHGLVRDDNGITVGVLGETKSTTGFGVFSRGEIGATGTKSFVIDHPSDPENRYLRHYCAEGPEPRNVYVGRVTTDQSGYATVRLPSYYAAVNRNPEYTLTIIDSGDDFVLAKVTREVVGNTFQIRTSKPGCLVSWRVDAVRNDRAVQRSGIDAEPAKPQRSKGTYLAPDLYGKPESLAQWKVSRPVPQVRQEHGRLRP